MKYDRLDRQIAFVIEIDKLKGVLRQTILMDGSRQENADEHSWHLAVMALLLSDYAVENNIDLLRVIKMLLIHDIVEIDAGDTYCYDDAEVAKQAAREKKASERLFNILPLDQSEGFRRLWDEFEARKTSEVCLCHNRMARLRLGPTGGRPSLLEETRQATMSRNGHLLSTV